MKHQFLAGGHTQQSIANYVTQLQQNMDHMLTKMPGGPVGDEVINNATSPMQELFDD